MVTIDDWVADRGLDRLDLIKLDIEGAEPMAIEGALRTIESLKPILVIELNPVALWRFQRRSCWELFDRLEALFGVVSVIRTDGSLLPIKSRGLADRLLQQSGTIDLVCMVDPGDLRARFEQRARSAKAEIRLARRFNRRRPSPVAFLYDPSYEARFMINQLRLRAGEVSTIPVRLRNTGTVWFNSDYPNHPIGSSYHWIDANGTVIERDGPRTLFAEPLGPDQQTIVQLHVEAPREPGQYTLGYSLVQERFAWCDDLRPELRADLPVTVF